MTKRFSIIIFELLYQKDMRYSFKLDKEKRGNEFDTKIAGL